MHVQLVCVAWDGQGGEPAGDDMGTPGEDDAAREARQPPIESGSERDPQPERREQHHQRQHGQLAERRMRAWGTAGSAST